MESNSCVNVEFVDIDEDSFYFGVVEPDLEQDDFRESREHHWTMESCHKDGAGYLILNQEENKFELQTWCEKKVRIVSYRKNLDKPDTLTLDRSGKEQKEEKLPVMIGTLNNSNQMMVVGYDKTEGIQAVPMTPPTDIPGMHHEALFYQTRLDGTNRFKFVFSVDPSKVLGVVLTNSENSLYKLALLPEPTDHVDEGAVFVLHE